MLKRTRPVVVTAAVALLPVTGCGQAEDMRDANLRTLTSRLGAAAFEDVGHPVKGELSCDTADKDAYKVTCDGEDTRNRSVSLVLRADENTASEGNSRLKGTIVGKVEDKEVFRKECLGQC
ncbi:hypothetical protein ABTZ58_24030 [Streptomyces sp. NPDC094143]|uniref:hypothetical protein n=1 Tax=Streptomyces sp. NPDC094143 TaxID=3155310 RepID=UPI003333FA34